MFLPPAPLGRSGSKVKALWRLASVALKRPQAKPRWMRNGKNATSSTASGPCSRKRRPGQAIGDLLKSNAKMAKDIEAFQREAAGNVKSDLIANLKSINGINVCGAVLDLDAKNIKDLAFQLKAEQAPFLGCLEANQGAKSPCPSPSVTTWWRATTFMPDSWSGSLPHTSAAVGGSGLFCHGRRQTQAAFRRLSMPRWRKSQADFLGGSGRHGHGSTSMSLLILRAVNGSLVLLLFAEAQVEDVEHVEHAGQH